MQNYTKSQTRLAFVQYIFQNQFLNKDSLENIDDFQKHFYDTNIAIIDEKKEIKLKFNKNFLNKLFISFKNNIDKKNITEDLNGFIDINRRFEKWDNILKSIIFAIIAELLITEKNKFKIVFNDYLNISKSLVSEKETKLINAIIQKYIDKNEIIKK
jgi:transcription termination factor NusB